MPQRKTPELPRIHQGKTPVRVHFIPEWAEAMGKIQADFVKKGLADKGTVSKWFSGTIPTPDNLERIAAFLGREDIRELFRHPDDDWLARFFEGRSKTERERIKATLDVGFPKARIRG